MATMWTKKESTKCTKSHLYRPPLWHLSSDNSHGSVGKVHAQFVITFHRHHSSGVNNYFFIYSIKRRIANARGV